MTEPAEGAIREFELMAYVDGQLDDGQRLEVEDYLSRQPELAAQVMADMRTREALRMAGNKRTPPASPRTAQALGKLEGVLLRQRNLRLMRWPAAFAAFAGVGWIAHGPVPAPVTAAAPSIIDDAVMAHRTTLLRARMRSQVETAVLDTAEIWRAAHVRLPALPEGWRITDVQMFPSDDGPGVQVALDPPGPGSSLSLFAVESTDELPDEPTLAARGSERVAYWRRGGTAFALTGALDAPMLPAALDFADNPLR